MWTQECNVTFHKVKQVISQAPVLAYRASKDAFVLDTGLQHWCRALPVTGGEVKSDRMFNEVRAAVLCDEEAVTGL